MKLSVDQWVRVKHTALEGSIKSLEGPDPDHPIVVQFFRGDRHPTSNYKPEELEAPPR